MNKKREEKKITKIKNGNGIHKSFESNVSDNGINKDSFVLYQKSFDVLYHLIYSFVLPEIKQKVIL